MVVHKCVAGMKTLVKKGVFIPVLWNKSPNAAYLLTSIEVQYTLLISRKTCVTVTEE